MSRMTRRGTVAASRRRSVVGAKYPFRGLFDILRDSITDGWWATSNMNVIEAYHKQDAPINTLVKVLDGASAPFITAPTQGWGWMGGMRSRNDGGPSGGVMKIENAADGGYTDKIIDVLTNTDGGVRTMPCQHPRNSHRYCILDVDQIKSKSFIVGTYGAAEWTATLNAIDAFRNKIHAVYAAHNPSVTPICSMVAFRPEEVAELGAVVDELWFDGYATKSSGYDSSIITAQADAADAAGVPYVGICSAHDYTGYDYPTPPVFSQEMTDWKGTGAGGIMVYLFPDDGVPVGGQNLAADTTSGLRECIASEMLAVS